MSDAFDPLRRVLDGFAEAEAPARLWLRDDDAVGPTPALDRLLALGAECNVPLTLAVIPQATGQALADLLQGLAVEVAPHGWSHADHAAPGAKSCELSATRPEADVLANLAAGLSRLRDLYGPRLVPVLVPPWNRIAPALIGALPGLGYRALSVFGPEQGAAPPQRINVHVDLIDWRGTRGGQEDGALVADLVTRLKTGAPTGFLTHHLVHDAAAWSFTERMFAITTGHPGARWCRLSSLLEGSPDQALAQAQAVFS